MTALQLARLRRFHQWRRRQVPASSELARTHNLSKLMRGGLPYSSCPKRSGKTPMSAAPRLNSRIGPAAM